MDSYYDDILKKIKDLMDEGKYAEANKLLEEELAMPYIPFNVEEELIQCYNECRSELRAHTQKAYSEDDIEAMLAGELDEQFLAIEQLKKSNIRNYVDVIQNFLSQKNVHTLVRSLLIEAMMDQNITDEFTCEINGLEVCFSPCAIDSVMESEGVNKAVMYLRKWFENDNPTFAMMCVESLIKEAYLRLPFTIEEDEGEALAAAIVHYVFVAHEEYEAWQSFCKEKNLAQYNGYELLLNTYDSL